MISKVMMLSSLGSYSGAIKTPFKRTKRFLSCFYRTKRSIVELLRQGYAVPFPHEV